MNLISRNVSKALMDIFRESNMTLEEFSKEVSIRPEHMSKYINQKSTISFDKGLDIAMDLDCRVKFLQYFKRHMNTEIDYRCM